MIGPWHGIAPQPQHHRTALSCGSPACAPGGYPGCAAGFPAEREATVANDRELRRFRAFLDGVDADDFAAYNDRQRQRRHDELKAALEQSISFLQSVNRRLDDVGLRLDGWEADDAS